MVYYSFFILLSIVLLLGKISNKNSNYNRSLILLLAILFIIFGGLRNNVGADWDSYKNFFSGSYDSFSQLSFQVDYLFKVLLILIRKISDSYAVMILVIFSISFVLKFIVIKRYSVDILCSLLIYYCTVFLYFDLNGIRQGLALSVIMLTVQPVLSNDLKKYLLLWLIASLLHVSAVVFFPFYWIAKLNFSRIQYILIVMASLAVSVYFGKELLNIIGTISNILTEDVFTKYSTYINDDFFGRSADIISVPIIQRALIFLSSLVLYGRINIGNNIKRVLFNGYFLSFVLFIVFSQCQEIATRLSYYYRVFEMLLIPAFLTISTDKSIKVVITLFIIAYCVIGLVRMLSIEDGGLLPYHNLIFS